MSDEPVPGPIRRRNIVLGLLIGAACILIITVLIIFFDRGGLPKDPQVWKRMQQDEQVRQP